MYSTQFEQPDPRNDAFLIADGLEELQLDIQKDYVLKHINDYRIIRIHLDILVGEANRRKRTDILEKLEFAGLIHKSGRIL